MFYQLITCIQQSSILVPLLEHLYQSLLGIQKSSACMVWNEKVIDIYNLWYACIVLQFCLSLLVIKAMSMSTFVVFVLTTKYWAIAITQCLLTVSLFDYRYVYKSACKQWWYILSPFIPTYFQSWRLLAPWVSKQKTMLLFHTFKLPWVKVHPFLLSHRESRNGY